MLQSTVIEIPSKPRKLSAECRHSHRSESSQMCNVHTCYGHMQPAVTSLQGSSTLGGCTGREEVNISTNHTINCFILPLQCQQTEEGLCEPEHRRGAEKHSSGRGDMTSSAPPVSPPTQPLHDNVTTGNNK